MKKTKSIFTRVCLADKKFFQRRNKNKIMKKLRKTVFALACGLLMTIGTIHTMPSVSHEDQLANATDTFIPQGDLNGGARFTYTTHTPDVVSTVRILPQNPNFGTDGFYIRLKNNTNVLTPICAFVNSTNGHRVAIKAHSDAAPITFKSYDANGNYLSDITGRTWPSYIMLPGNFDGWIYCSTDMFQSDAGALAGTTMNWNSIFAIYLGISTQYDAPYADYEVGDIVNANGSLLDTSTLSDTEFEGHFVKDWEVAYVNITRLANEKDFTPNGDLEGAATLTYTSTPTSSFSVVRIHPTDQNLSGDGLYMRIRNNNKTGSNPSYIDFDINGTNGHRVAPIVNAPLYTYNTAGENKQTVNCRDFGRYITIPVGFDGYLYIPYTSLESLPATEWPNNANTEMTYNSVFALYLTVDTFYDSWINITIGDIFTINHKVFDGSEITAEDFPSIVTNDNNNIATITQEKGFKPSVPEFDYNTPTYAGDVENGAKLTFSQSTNDILSVVKIVPTITDYSGVQAFVFRMYNIMGDYPFHFNVVDADGARQALGGTNFGKVYFKPVDGNVIANRWGGNPITTFTPSPFDGWCIIPVKTLNNAVAIDFTRISHFEIKVATFYDYNFANVFGDTGVIDAEGNYVSTLDVSELTDDQFAKTFVKGDNADYASIERYKVARLSEWIGDVKILDSLNYGTTEKLKQNITWDPGDNVCSYDVLDDGMKVDIGPYEPGHMYGQYMCLGMFNKGVTTDRCDWFYNDESGNTVWAKGITMYLKNLSRREIGINLQFDEVGSKSMERWIVKGYPAMYYAYDVVKDADYILYAKSDQIQIPVGFEGYVRIPFSSYSVPDWCHGTGFENTDDILDISKTSGNFFLTSDNVRYEDLSFFIKNVGIYFNETRAGSLFNQENTIKANMQLGE